MFSFIEKKFVCALFSRNRKSNVDCALESTSDFLEMEVLWLSPKKLQLWGAFLFVFKVCKINFLLLLQSRKCPKSETKTKKARNISRLKVAFTAFMSTSDQSKWSEVYQWPKKLRFAPPSVSGTFSSSCGAWAWWLQWSGTRRQKRQPATTAGTSRKVSWSLSSRWRYWIEKDLLILPTT